MATIGFATVQMYLTGLAKANGNLASSPHGAFWLGTYEEFIVGTLPGVEYRGAAIPLILKAAPLLSPFFMIGVYLVAEHRFASMTSTVVKGMRAQEHLVSLETELDGFRKSTDCPIVRHCQIDTREQLFDGLRVQLWVFIERGVEVRHVRLVMFVVMNFHRARVDVRLEGAKCIGKGWK